MPVPVPMPVVVWHIAQQPGGDQIDEEADDGDENGLREVDRHRRIEPHQAFPADQQRHQRQKHGAGEAGEITELAGAEGEARVVGLAPACR